MNVIMCCCFLSVCCCYLPLTLLTISSCNKSITCWISLGRDQAPTSGETWAVRGASVSVVVEIPDRCLPTGRIVNQIIRMPVIVKVGRSH